MLVWIFLTLVIILFVGYAVLIEMYRRWFLKVPLFQPLEIYNSHTTFSVIIPARNEESKIASCVESVLQQIYPTEKFEVIVIDDHSTDATATIIEQLQKKHANLKLIKLHELLNGKQLNSYKKKAIELAVEQASGEWIVTTDADCIVTPEWLSIFNETIIQKQPYFIAAPVSFTNTGSFVSKFQCLDFMTLQGITVAAVHHKFHSMCNGANLAYHKQVFKEVGGFAGVDNIASGDDMLLMHKIYKKYPEKIAFALSRNAIVKTEPMHTWRSFINQRIRWASKADKYDDKRIFIVLLLVYILNFLLFILPFTALFDVRILWVWLILLALKTIIEFRFIIPVAKFFKEEKLLWWFPVMQPFHIIYTVIAGWLGKFGKYTWKGRQVK